MQENGQRHLCSLKYVCEAICSALTTNHQARNLRGGLPYDLPPPRGSRVWATSASAAAGCVGSEPCLRTRGLLTACSIAASRVEKPPGKESLGERPSAFRHPLRIRALAWRVNMDAATTRPAAAGEGQRPEGLPSHQSSHHSLFNVGLPGTGRQNEHSTFDSNDLDQRRLGIPIRLSKILWQDMSMLKC